MTSLFRRGNTSGGAIRKIAAVAVAGALIAGSMLLGTAPASATTSPSLFDPGLIASDVIFYNSATMTSTQIQAFLNAKLPKCATGSTCLNKYSAFTNVRASDAMCKGYPVAADQSAATIIANVSTSCGINPQVLIVLLQKEQGLVTSTAPTSSKYLYATGYACPDTTGCQAKYSGFFNQVYDAARQFIRYGMYPSSYNYQVGKTKAIPYNTNAKCGSRTVTIQSKATAALYDYTPYTPDQSAINNMYGTGDSCSSYGNRNFFRYFTDWFGSPALPDNLVRYVDSVYRDVLGRNASTREYPGWVKQILNGMPRAKVGVGFVTSTEYRNLMTIAAYKAVLGRTPSTAEVTGWVTAMKKGYTTPDGIWVIFLSTKEFYNDSGATNAGYVNGVFKKIVGRAATAAEQASWSKVIVAKGSKAFVNAIFTSREAERVQVNAAFKKFLGRAASTNDQNIWATYVHTHGLLSLRVQILGSTEYWNRAQKTPVPTN
ncbi:MAG: hypothetical protein JWQ47_149 [Glaciihabitans sp.]|nr:hypothetical protein [Glaciihabitans sp.]